MTMDMITPTLSEIRGGTSEARTLQETGGSLDRHKDHSSAIFSGFAGFLAILLTTMIFYGLWNWNKLKKRQVPYFRVTVMPLLTLSRPRQGAKNIYDSLPQRQEDLGRRQSRSNRIFSTESLLSRHSESPPSEHVNRFVIISSEHSPAAADPLLSSLPKTQRFRVRIPCDHLPAVLPYTPSLGSAPTSKDFLGEQACVADEGQERRYSTAKPSQAGNVLWVHRDHYPANGYAVGIYDNATGLQMRGDLTPSAHYVNVTASRDCLSISSEDSRDYINVPTADQIAETLLASANATPTNSFAPPNAQKLELTEEREQGCGNASDHTSFWSPRSESDDPLSDEESSSETSNDYVNMAGLNLEAIHGKQPWMVSQCYRDYENVPSSHASGNQQQAEEEVTSSNTDHVEGRTDGPGTHVPFVMQSGRFLALGDYVTYPPSAQKETSQMKHGEEMPNEASDDYENVLAANFGDVDPEGPDA